MKILSRRMKLLLMAATLVVAVLTVIVNFTDACRLEMVTLDGLPVSDWPQQYDMLRQGSLFRQPFDSLAQALLAGENTFQVDISCSWPHTLQIRTNAFEPVCFLVDKTTGRIWGLDLGGRAVPLDHAVTDWERPVLTGIGGIRAFQYARDVRVKVVVDQLASLRHRNRNLLRLVDEVDFETTDYLQVALAGQSYRLVVRPERLVADLERLVELITRFDADLDGVSRIDLRYDSLIICDGGKN